MDGTCGGLPHWWWPDWPLGEERRWEDCATFGEDMTILPGICADWAGRSGKCERKTAKEEAGCGKKTT